MGFIGAAIAVIGVWVTLSAVAAVFALIAYAGWILLSGALVGAIAVMIAVGAAVARTPPRSAAHPPARYVDSYRQTYPVHTAYLADPGPLRGAMWQGLSGWTAVPPPAPAIDNAPDTARADQVSAAGTAGRRVRQRRQPSRFGRAGGAR